MEKNILVLVDVGSNRKEATYMSSTTSTVGFVVLSFQNTGTQTVDLNLPVRSSNLRLRNGE